MAYLLKAIDTYRVANLDEVEELHQELLNDNTFELVAYSYKHKEIKVKGEVVGEYELVSATKVFTDEKDPLVAYTANYREA